MFNANINLNDVDVWFDLTKIGLLPEAQVEIYKFLCYFEGRYEQLDEKYNISNGINRDVLIELTHRIEEYASYTLKRQNYIYHHMDQAEKYINVKKYRYNIPSSFASVNADTCISGSQAVVLFRILQLYIYNLSDVEKIIGFSNDPFFAYDALKIVDMLESAIGLAVISKISFK